MLNNWLKSSPLNLLFHSRGGGEKESEQKWINCTKHTKHKKKNQIWVTSHLLFVWPWRMNRAFSCRPSYFDNNKEPWKRLDGCNNVHFPRPSQWNLTSSVIFPVWLSVYGPPFKVPSEVPGYQLIFWFNRYINRGLKLPCFWPHLWLTLYTQYYGWIVSQKQKAASLKSHTS